MTTQREHLIQRVARTIVWSRAQQYERDSARSIAIRVVDDLLNGSAEGKAIERGVKAIVTRIEKSA